MAEDIKKTVIAPVTGVPEKAPVAQASFDYSNLGAYIPMMNLRPITEVANWLNVLIYGPFGDGKTHLAATAMLVPEMCDVLYLSLEGGEKTLKTVADMCIKKGISTDKIMVMPIQTYKQFAQMYETLRMHVQYRDSNNVDGLRAVECQLRGVELLQRIGWQPVGTEGPAIVAEMSAKILSLSKDKVALKELIPEPKRFKTVIVDSLTEAQKYCMYQLLGIDPLKQKLDTEPDSAEWKDWGSSREMIQFLVRRFRDLAINALFICGEDDDTDDKKRRYITPMLPGKLSKDVRGLVDVVAYIKAIPQENGMINRRVTLVGGAYGGADIAAKHRFGPKLKGCWLDNPTMQTFYDMDNK